MIAFFSVKMISLHVMMEYALIKQKGATAYLIVLIEVMRTIVKFS